MTHTRVAVLVAAFVLLAGCSGGADVGAGGANPQAADAAATGGGQLGYSVGGAKDVNNFRDNVENGYLPLTSDMTYEGLFYDYYFDTGKQERCTELFCPTYSQAITRDPLSNETERYMTVGLNSGLNQSAFERKKLNLVVVLDVSGSMSEAFNRYYYDDNGSKRESDRQPKIKAAKESVLALTDHLREGDRFGMVTYSDDAQTIVPMSGVGDRDMEAVRSQIRQLDAGGGTNLHAGMGRATEMIEPYADSNASEYETRIIYVTDAMPNLGDTSTEGLGGALSNHADRGIYTTFVGVGVDFNTRLVESISDVRGANYYSVHSAVQFEERMDEGFQYMVTPLVFDLDLTLESEGYEIEKVYGSPEADASTGELLQVNTLFPSRTKNGTTKGGVILLKLEKTGAGSTLELTASYENRVGKTFENSKTVTFENREPEYFENSGIRKAVLLSQYADLVKNWVDYERMRITDHSPAEPSDGIAVHESRDLGEWERQSTELRVSPKYRDRVEQFRQYFDEEMTAIGDETLAQELELLTTLAAGPENQTETQSTA